MDSSVAVCYAAHSKPVSSGAVFYIDRSNKTSSASGSKQSQASPASQPADKAEKPVTSTEAPTTTSAAPTAEEKKPTPKTFTARPVSPSQPYAAVTVAAKDSNSSTSVAEKPVAAKETSANKPPKNASDKKAQVSIHNCKHWLSIPCQCDFTLQATANKINAMSLSFY